MKNLQKRLYFLLLLVFINGCSAKIPPYESEIAFIKKKYDFGKIRLNQEASYSFEFSNTGKTQLVIFDVKTSCGCTVPDWKKAPILPGRKGRINVRYDTSFPGVFHKTIEVCYNGPESPAQLEISGEVESME